MDSDEWESPLLVDDFLVFIFLDFLGTLGLDLTFLVAGYWT